MMLSFLDEQVLQHAQASPVVECLCKMPRGLTVAWVEKDPIRSDARQGALCLRARSGGGAAWYTMSGKCGLRAGRGGRRHRQRRGDIACSSHCFSLSPLTRSHSHPASRPHYLSPVQKREGVQRRGCHSPPTARSPEGSATQEAPNYGSLLILILSHSSTYSPVHSTTYRASKLPVFSPRTGFVNTNPITRQCFVSTKQLVNATEWRTAGEGGGVLLPSSLRRRRCLTPMTMTLSFLTMPLLICELPASRRRSWSFRTATRTTISCPFAT